VRIRKLSGRRGLSLVLAVGAAVALCSWGLSVPKASASAGSSAKVPPTTAITISVVPGVGTVLAPLAQALGYFKKEHLKANLETIPVATTAVQLISAGRLQFAVSDPYSILEQRQKGIDLRIAASNYTVQNSLICQKSLNITGSYPSVMKQLVGKTVGVSSIGSGTYIYAADTLKSAGVNPASVQITATGGPGTSVAAFKAGSIDCLIAYPPIQAEVASQATTVVNYLAGQGPKVLTDGVATIWVTSLEYATDHPQAVKEFATAIALAQVFVKNPKNASKVFSLLSGTAFQGLTASVVVPTIKAVANTWNAKITKAQLAATVSSDEQVTGIKASLPYTQYFAPAIFPMIGYR
jgi:NitT/TauT family transport system substrate-binding protein